MVREVEFVGGPLDGHTHFFRHAADRLPALATLDVSPDFVRVLTRRQRKINQNPTSTAVYSLERENDGFRYYHVASIGVQKPRIPMDQSLQEPSDV